MRMLPSEYAAVQETILFCPVGLGAAIACLAQHKRELIEPGRCEIGMEQGERLKCFVYRDYLVHSSNVIPSGGRWKRFAKLAKLAR